MSENKATILGKIAAANRGESKSIAPGLLETPKASEILPNSNMGTQVEIEAASAAPPAAQSIAERSIPQLKVAIEAAYGLPIQDHALAPIVNERITGHVEGLLSKKMPGHLARLGAAVCQAHQPKCEKCAIKNFCAKYSNSTPPQKIEGPKVIELFCGAGGLSLGFEQAGFRVAEAHDLSQTAIDTYNANRPGYQHGQVTDIVQLVESKPLASQKGKIDGLIGGPPCQTFSLVGIRTKNNTDSDGNPITPTEALQADARTWLPLTFVEAVNQLQPRFSVMENVAAFKSALGGKVLQDTLQAFDDAGYLCDTMVLNANQCGVAQNRKRFVIISLRKDLPDAEEKLGKIVTELKNLEEPPVTVQEAFQLLSAAPTPSVGEGSECTPTPEGFIWNHKARKHNPRDIQIYTELKQGETAKQLEERKPGMIPYALDSFHDKYRRLSMTQQAPTIPAHLKKDANSFIHPAAARGITPREAAVLQGFPVDYVFTGPFTNQFMQIGNAVPPPMAHKIATELLSSI